MSTTAVTYGSYVVEGGPNLERLNEVNGRSRDKSLSLEEMSVTFKLIKCGTNDKTVARMTITNIEPSLTSEDRVYITGYNVGSNKGQVTVHYNTVMRRGELELTPFSPRAQRRRKSAR